MTTQTLTYKTVSLHNMALKSFVRELHELFQHLSPRPVRIISVGLLLLGVAIPLLMLLELIPVSIFLAFIVTGALTGGGVLLLS